MRKIYILVLFIFSINKTNAQWANRYIGQGDFSDKFNAIVTDASGNIFECGSTVRPSKNRDILLVKLTSAGDTVWTNVYNGPGNGPDEANAIVLDNVGNIYITGFQRGANTATDIVTIKYNSAGIIQWVASYFNVEDQSDIGTSLSVDASGNVYVTGQTDTDPSAVTNEDYVTIKYNASGVQQWLVLKNGLGNGTDRPCKLVIDASNNVFVSGRSFNGSEDDYLTIKYNGTNGAQLWQQLVDRTHYDRPTDMAINLSTGNIYVTGRSKDLTYDYVTVAYNTSGTLLWQKVYDYIDDDRATAIGIDNAGNIYVTGESDFNADVTIYNYNITTLKYDAAGNQLWAKNYIGVAGNDDVPNSIFIDGSANVYVAGTTDLDPLVTESNDYVILKYNTAGTQQWANTYNATGASNDIANDICADASGNVFTTGYSEFIPEKNGTTLKYNAGGTLQWAKYYNGIGDNSSNSHSVAIDANDNVFIAGYTVEYGTDRNFALQKINAGGITQWVRTINGTSSFSVDDAYGVAVDASGNIFVGGYVKNSNVSNDYLIAKYNQNGDSLWTKTYDYISSSDKAVALALDAAGNVYLTGRSDSDPTLNSNDDALTVKWNTNGVFQWATRYNGLGNSSDLAKSIKIGSSGNIYISGKTFNGVNSDYLLVKYNSTGTQQWVRTFDGNGEDDAIAMAIDNNENLYLTGSSRNILSTDTNIVTLKYNSVGALQWSKTYDGNAHGVDIGKSIAVDANGNVIVGGSTDTDSLWSTINDDYITLKYDANGTLLWSQTYNDTLNSNDEVNEVGVDSQNNIYVTGQSDNVGLGLLNYDFVNIKYSPAGVVDSNYTYDGPGMAKDIPSTLLIKGNDVYVTGGSVNANKQRDIVTFKNFGQTFTGIPNEVFEKLDFAVYPNPFYDFTVLKLTQEFFKDGQSAKIKILDLNGKTVREFNTNAAATTINKNELTAGIYILRVTDNKGIIENKKLIIQ